MGIQTWLSKYIPEKLFCQVKFLIFFLFGVVEIVDELREKRITLRSILILPFLKIHRFLLHRASFCWPNGMNSVRIIIAWMLNDIWAEFEINFLFYWDYFFITTIRFWCSRKPLQWIQCHSGLAGLAVCSCGDPEFAPLTETDCGSLCNSITGQAAPAMTVSWAGKTSHKKKCTLWTKLLIVGHMHPDYPTFGNATFLYLYIAFPPRKSVV